MKKAKFLIPALVIIAALCFSACNVVPNEWSKAPRELQGTWTLTNKPTDMSEYYSFYPPVKVEVSAKDITITYDGSSEKGQVAYGMGPIKGSFGDDYEVTYFQTSYTSGGTTTTVQGNETRSISFTIKDGKIVSDYSYWNTDYDKVDIVLVYTK